MIASFAFNFNNFNNIYLLTDGGPYTGDSSVAGSTDILITLHLQARDRDRQGQDFAPRERGRDHHLLHRGRDLGHSRSTARSHWRTWHDDRRSRVTPAATAASRARAATRARKRREAADAQGQLVAAPRRLIAVVVALFPVVFIVSSAFNRDNTLQARRSIPTHVTLHNFGNLLHNNVSTSGGGKADAPYVHWVLNSMIVAGVDRALHDDARRARRVRVQPLPLQGPTAGDAAAAADPDVPAVRRRRRDLPARAERRRASSRRSGSTRCWP